MPQTVLRIRDVYPGSRILIFTHPGSWIRKKTYLFRIPDPGVKKSTGSRIRIRNTVLKYKMSALKLFLVCLLTVEPPLPSVSWPLWDHTPSSSCQTVHRHSSSWAPHTWRPPCSSRWPQHWDWPARPPAPRSVLGLAAWGQGWKKPGFFKKNLSPEERIF